MIIINAWSIIGLFLFAIGALLAIVILGYSTALAYAKGGWLYIVIGIIIIYNLFTIYLPQWLH